MDRRPQLQGKHAQVSTLWYRAPEVCLGGCQYGAGVGTWSYGRVLGELVNQEPILEGQSEY